METDGDLVRRARAGDAAAFGELIAVHERAALALAYAAAGDAATAGDVVQEAFLRAWQRLGELKDPGRFGAWLGRIVRNGAADAARRRPAAASSLDHPSAAAAASADPGPADRGCRDEARAAIDDALAALDELTRSAVVLRYFDDLPSRQIGDLLGLSAAAVDMRLSRGRAVLREKLAAHGPAVATGGGRP